MNLAAQISIDVQNFVKDEMFTNLATEFQSLIESKDSENSKDILMRIKRITSLMFGKDITIALVDNPGWFYGFRVFPSKSLVNRTLEIIFDKNDVSEEERKSLFAANWMNSSKWHIDVDAKLIRDIGNLLNGKDLAILYFYSMLRVIFNPDVGKLAWYYILVNLDKLCRKNQFIATNPGIRHLFGVPIYLAVSEPAYTIDKKYLDELFGSISPTRAQYDQSISKIINRYGMMNFINVKETNVASSMQYAVGWIAEAICDLKYSANRMIHNIEKITASTTSPYMRAIYSDILLGFNKIHGKYLGIQDSLESTQFNPDQKKLLETMTEEYWKKQVSVMESQDYYEFIDPHGFVKKVNQRDIDIIRIELGNATSTEDKIYLMERLYKHIGAIDAALEMLKDKKTACKVKQSRNELERLKDSAEETRMAIIKFKIAPEQYGLYIKYPAGFEG